MTQDERLDFLLRYLLAERKEYADVRVPDAVSEKRRLLRSLMNVRPPSPASEDFLNVQDAYLREQLAEKGVTKPADLAPVQPGLYLWQGDITTLAVDAIVNAANSRLLGLLRSLSQLHRQCCSHLCGGAASSGMCPHHGGAEERGTRRQGKNHKSL